jgi:hypothetical protein
MPETSVRSLEPQDLGFLCLWMNEPHLRPFYMQEEISLESVKRKFTPRIDRNGTEADPCHCLIAECDGQPFGYIQWYLNRDIPDYGVSTIGQTGGVSLDYFIGQPSYLGKVLGAAMLIDTMNHVSQLVAPADRQFFVGHEPANIQAIKCSTRAGFTLQDNRNFVENGHIYQL